MDDYHAFMSTSSNSENSTSGGGGFGCGSGCLLWVLVIIGLLWFVGQAFG